MKIVKYVLFPLPYIIVFLLFVYRYQSITFIVYLIYMIIPMIISAVVLGIAKHKSLFSQKPIILSIICTATYLVFFLAVSFYGDKHDAFQHIYENSLHLFREGFSIGSDFAFSPVDILLPCFACFAVHMLSFYCAKKLNKGHKK